MESAVIDSIINGLQQLKIATYDSLAQFDHSYSVDSYKNGLRLLETRGQVKRLVFQVGKSERLVWLLPWYDDDAFEKMGEMEDATLAYLETTPSTSGQIREYFLEKYPAYHQICYLLLRRLVAEGRVAHQTFNEGRWVTVYYLPTKKIVLEALLSRALDYVNWKGYAFSNDLSVFLNIPKRLAYALLAMLACQNMVSRFKIGWSYVRNTPIFAYCKEGYEAQAVTRYREVIAKRTAQQRKSRTIDTFLASFRDACLHMKASESLADLAGSYFRRAITSSLVKGRDAKSLAWGCFFLANKILRQGIVPGEIESYAKIQRRTLLMISKDINDVLELTISDLYSHPREYLGRIAQKMGLPEQLEAANGSILTVELIGETDRFIESIPRFVFFGKRPESLAAAALYITAQRLGVQLPQRQISEAADVTEVTLRNTMQSIRSGVPSFQGRREGSAGTIMLVEDHRANKLASELSAKGLLKYEDKWGIVKWGTPEQVLEWRLGERRRSEFESRVMENGTERPRGDNNG